MTPTMRFRFAACVLAVLVLAPLPARTQSANEAPSYRLELGDTDAAELTTVLRDGVAVIGTNRRVAAYDARSGSRLWSRDDVRSPALTDRALYVARFRTRSSAPGALMALAPRTGATLRKRPADVAGPIVVDDAGIVAGGFSSLGAFALDGTPRWSRPFDGRIARILSLGTMVLVNSFRSGALLHGELETFDRSTGVRRGISAPYDTGRGHAVLWIDPLLDVSGGHAYGANDFTPDFETVCTQREIIDVDLATMTSNRLLYVLEPRPTQNVCVGDRARQLTTTVSNGIVALGSGTSTGFFRLGSAAPIVPVLHDAVLVGGPFAGYYFLNRSHGLEALRLDSAGAHMLRFRNIRAPHVAVAGIADRLYVATANVVTAFAVGRFDGAPVRRYAARCPVLTAIGRADRDDLLICRDDPLRGATSVIAVPR